MRLISKRIQIGVSRKPSRWSFGSLFELWSVRQTSWWLLEHGLPLPVRPVSAAITWRRPSYGMVYRLLSSPCTEPRAISRRNRVSTLVLIPNPHEGYVSWEGFEQTQQTMAANGRGWGSDEVSSASHRAAALPPLRSPPERRVDVSPKYDGSRN
jgi:hypothetical protein